LWVHFLFQHGHLQSGIQKAAILVLQSKESLDLMIN